MIDSTGHDWEQVGWQWDLPRLTAWNRYTGKRPSLAVMVGHYLGYKPPEPDTSKLTKEQHAIRLLSELGMNVGHKAFHGPR